MRYTLVSLALGTLLQTSVARAQQSDSVLVAASMTKLGSYPVLIHGGPGIGDIDCRAFVFESVTIADKRTDSPNAVTAIVEYKITMRGESGAITAARCYGGMFET